MSEKIKTKSKLKESTAKVLQWFSGFIILLLLLRLVEWSYLSYFHEIDGLFMAEMAGFITDLRVLATPLIGIGIILVLFCLLHQKLALLLFLVLVFAYAIFELALIVYFQEALTILDYGAMATMSNAQVSDIVQLYGFGWWHLLLLLPIATLLFFVWFYAQIIGKFKAIKIIVLILFISLSFTNLAFYQGRQKNKAEITAEIALNKTTYYIQSYFDYYRELNALLNADIQKALSEYYTYHPELESSNYYNFPFFNSSTTENYLGDYFVQQDSAPNVVVIICESLGRIYSGENAKLGSFTPFLDSLANEGLYWSNALANAERTFGAIPNVLAGVPEGRTGFLNLKSSMPDHLSLPLLLKEANNYQTSFYCGTEETYDNMIDYLKFQKFDNIHGKSAFKENLNLQTIKDEAGVEKVFNWGAEDAAVFKESMSLMLQDSVLAPFFNLYLTTSFHEPYSHNRRAHFVKLAEARIKELNPGKNRKQYFKKKEKFGALMYMDDAIRQCIELYQERSDFENTIFVIVGDHSLKMMTNDARIEKYHVPLLIYSPLLIKTGRFENVVCQKDIPSALQALLRDNFNLRMPDFCISQSHNLRTAVNFESRGEFVFMYSHKSMENYLRGRDFICDGEVSTLNSDMKLMENKNKSLLDSMTLLLENYRVLANYVCQKNMYLPSEKYDEFVAHLLMFQMGTNFDEADTALIDFKYKDFLTSERSFSEANSISNKGQENFKLLFDEPFVSDKRVRVKLKFMLYETELWPFLYVATKTKTRQLVSNTNFIIGPENCKVRSTSKKNWVEIETAVWIEANPLNQYININLHMPSKTNFYLDNLKIEIKEF